MHESLPNPTPSEQLPYLSDDDLVEAYLDGERSGYEVMGRLLRKLGVPDEQAEQLLQTPLSKKDGSPLVDETSGQPFRIGDYLDGPARQHGNAEDSLLGFVAMDSSDTNFPQMQHVVRSLVQGYAGVQLERAE